MTLYKFGRFVVNAFFKVFFRVKFVGKENIPSVDERFIICANYKTRKIRFWSFENCYKYCC